MAFTYRDLAYTSPSGTRLEFTYDGGLADGVTHNLAEFQFADVDEKYFQDRVISSDGFAFTLFINDQDTLREVREALNEKAEADKVGTLEHPDPTIGNFSVVVASVRYEQNTVKGMGIVKVAVVFYRAIPNLLGGDISEATNPASASAAYKSINELNEKQARDFENSVDLSTGIGKSTLIAKSIAKVTSTRDKLKDIAKKVDAVNIAFENAVGEMIENMDDLILTPYNLARQIQNLIQLPMLAIESFNDRRDAYEAYRNETFGLTESEEHDIEAGNPQGKNVLSVVSLCSLAAVSAISYSAVTTQSATFAQIRGGTALDEGGYLSRLDIIAAINSVRSIAQDTSNRLSEYAAAFGAGLFFNQYFDYSVLNRDLIAAATRNLNGRLLSAAAEKIMVLEQDMNVVRVSALVYNSVEVATIQFLIRSNNLHGDDIWLCRRGTEILYY